MRKKRFVHHLNRTLGSLRNVLVLAGDFNMCGTREAQVYGPGVYCSKHPHPDRGLLLNLAKTHQLTALNTWSRPSAVFTFERTVSVAIDFIFGRMAQMDGRARQAEPDRPFTSSDVEVERGAILFTPPFRRFMFKLRLNL